MSNLEKIGIIGGKAIYADTGEDQIKILQEEIKRRVERKQLQVGQTHMMRVDFGVPLIIEVSVKPDLILDIIDKNS